MVGTTESVIRNHLRSTFDKLGVWSRLEIDYVYCHAGKGWHEASEGAPPPWLRGVFKRGGSFPRDKCCKRFAFDLRFTPELTSNSLIKNELQKLSFGL
jgi:hypothetical protein